MRPLAAALCVLIICIVSSLAPAAEELKQTAPPEPKDMKQVFNGKDLDNWEGDKRLFTAKDGVIRGETTKDLVAQGNTFLVLKDTLLKDFELRIKFKIEAGNSGIQYRSKLKPAKADAVNKWVVAGYQAEVENTPGKVGFLYHESGRGWLVNVGDKVEIGDDAKPKVVGSLGDKDALAKTYKKGDWNEYVIICKGNHVRHWLNGYQTVDLVDNDMKNRCMEGIFALQIHSGPPMWVEFKDIRLKLME